MYFDALTLAAVADELRVTILGGRVQRVLLPGPLSVGLEVYAQHQRYQLIASAHPQFARVHLVPDKPSRGVEQATPLLLLLRKYVLGGRIVAIDQPPLERMLFVSIAKEGESRNLAEEIGSSAPPDAAPSSGELGVAGPTAPLTGRPGPLLTCELVIEPMDRRSNIILVDEQNAILDSVKRVTPRMSQRVILPRQPYEVPPRQEKRDPRTATAEGIAALQQEGGDDLARAIVGSYRGVSPQAAREVVYRALGRAKVKVSDDLPWEAVAAALRELFTSPWAPSLVPGSAGQVGPDEAPGGPQAYAPYALTHVRGAEPQTGISAALTAFYAAREMVTAHQQRRDALGQQLATTRERLHHQRSRIASELERVTNVERLRWEGEMLFAFLHAIEPGQTTLEVEGQTIALDPERSPVECAQERFQAYSKARAGRDSLQQRLHETDAQLTGLEQIAALLAVADERDQIEQLALEAEDQGYLAATGGRPGGKPSGSARGRERGRERAKDQAKRRRFARRKPLHLVSSDGFDIYVGRSSVQNADVTFRIGRPDDLWLHVRTIPGAHVVVRAGGRAVPERTLQEAAGLAAYFSQARTENAVDVEVSRRRHVRKIPGAAPGLVTYRAEQTVRVAPLPPWG